MFARRIKQVVGLRRRNKQQVSILQPTLSLIMKRQPRFVEAMSNMVIKLFVLVTRYISLRACPQSSSAIDGLCPFDTCTIKLNRVGNMIGIGGDDMAQALSV